MYYRYFVKMPIKMHMGPELIWSEVEIGVNVVFWGDTGIVRNTTYSKQ